MTGACGFMKAKASTPSVQLTDQFIGASGSAAGSFTARYRVNSTGVIEQKLGNGSYTTLETWLQSGTAAGHSVRFTNTNGVAPTGTLGVFTALSTAQEISFAKATTGVQDSINTVEIRNDTTLAIVSCSVTLESEHL